MTGRSGADPVRGDASQSNDGQQKKVAVTVWLRPQEVARLDRYRASSPVEMLELSRGRAIRHLMLSGGLPVEVAPVRPIQRTACQKTAGCSLAPHHAGICSIADAESDL